MPIRLEKIKSIANPPTMPHSANLYGIGSSASSPVPRRAMRRTPRKWRKFNTNTEMKIPIAAPKHCLSMYGNPGRLDSPTALVITNCAL